MSTIRGRSELVFYEHKYTEIDPSAQDGGDWMNCMRCRHQTSECRSPNPDDARNSPPTKTTWGYTLPSKDALTNSCPYRPGMITVRVRRNGIVRTEWFDKAKLLAAVHEPAKPNNAAPPPPESETVLCVPASPGISHPWPADDDCKPVGEWTAKIVDDATSAAEKALAANPPVQPGPPAVDGESPSVAVTSVTSTKTPINNWFNGLVDDVYKQSYGGGPPPPPAEAAEPDKAWDDGKGAALDEDGDAPPPPQIKPEDCYGPPSLGCQVLCASFWRCAAQRRARASRFSAQTEGGCGLGNSWTNPRVTAACGGGRSCASRRACGLPGARPRPRPRPPCRAFVPVRPRNSATFAPPSKSVPCQACL
jgi:hypothetical protein